MENYLLLQLTPPVPMASSITSEEEQWDWDWEYNIIDGGEGWQDGLQGQWGVPHPGANQPVPIGWESPLGTAKLQVNKSLGEKVAEEGFPWGSSPPDCPGAGVGFPWRKLWRETVLHERAWDLYRWVSAPSSKENQSVYWGIHTKARIPDWQALSQETQENMFTELYK